MLHNLLLTALKGDCYPITIAFEDRHFDGRDESGGYYALALA